jgi:hypothetical protein
MRRLIEWLLANPLIAMIVLIWLVGAIGRAVSKTAGTPGRPRRGPGAPPAGGDLPTGMEPPVVQPAERRTQEEVAAEMRRILGMEPARPPTPARVQTPVPPRVPPLRRDVAHSERPPQPLQPRSLGQFAVQVDPHVGERIRARQAPATGAVGRSELGQLGGRQGRTRRRIARGGTGLIDLQNLPRAIVMREILDRPLALRPPFDDDA